MGVKLGREKLVKKAHLMIVTSKERHFKGLSKEKHVKLTAEYNKGKEHLAKVHEFKSKMHQKGLKMEGLRRKKQGLAKRDAATEAHAKKTLKGLVAREKGTKGKITEKRSKETKAKLVKEQEWKVKRRKFLKAHIKRLKAKAKEQRE